MKTITKVLVGAVLISGALLSSCGKYEEGPKISLASKKSRVEGTWTFEAYIENGVDKTAQVSSFYAGYSVNFTKDGKYTMTFGGFSDTGTWEFINDKESIKTLSNVSGSTPDTINIIRLKSKELWTKEVSGSNIYEYHWKQ